MKITDLETFLVAPRWLFLRIETDDGIVGWGEPVVEGRAEAVQAAVEILSSQLIGKDPLCIEDHWQVLAKGGFYRGGPVLSSALAGIDQALWDIKGKHLDVPVYELLGGPVRERVRIYTWIHGDDPHTLAEDALEKVDAGFTAVKCGVSDQLPPVPTARQTHAMIDRLTRLREAVGDDVDIALDFHGRFTGAAARRVLPLLEPLLPLFVEEPVLPEYTHNLSQMTVATAVPIALGERLYSRWDFRDVLGTGIAVAQPDLSHAGGISEVRRIAAAAETYDVSLAPHCPLGPIALAACLQTDVAVPNFLIQEQALDIHRGAGSGLLDYLVDPAVFTLRDGHIDRPRGPGLGIAVDESAVRRADEDGHRWRNTVWRHPDGSFAEW